MKDTIAVLERLIREGAITAFEFPHGSNAVMPHVIIAAKVVTDNRKPGYDRSRASVAA